MTNEELAKKMACKECAIVKLCESQNYESPCGAYEKALEMAEWKDSHVKDKRLIKLTNSIDGLIARIKSIQDVITELDEILEDEL